jgi:hypothetical protein
MKGVVPIAPPFTNRLGVAGLRGDIWEEASQSVYKRGGDSLAQT